MLLRMADSKMVEEVYWGDDDDEGVEEDLGGEESEVPVVVGAAV